jgi:hypothetical protein
MLTWPEVAMVEEVDKATIIIITITAVAITIT